MEIFIVKDFLVVNDSDNNFLSLMFFIEIVCQRWFDPFSPISYTELFSQKTFASSGYWFPLLQSDYTLSAFN